MSNTSTPQFLSDDERSRLQAYRDVAADDAPYLARVRLLLLHDQGIAAEIAAGQLNITIQRARSFIKAFNRERLGLFPANLFETKSTQE